MAGGKTGRHGGVCADWWSVLGSKVYFFSPLTLLSSSLSSSSRSCLRSSNTRSRGRSPEQKTRAKMKKEKKEEKNGRTRREKFSVLEKKGETSRRESAGSCSSAGKRRAVVCRISPSLSLSLLSLFFFFLSSDRTESAIFEFLSLYCCLRVTQLRRIHSLSLFLKTSGRKEKEKKRKEGEKI